MTYKSDIDGPVIHETENDLPVAKGIFDESFHQYLGLLIDSLECKLVGFSVLPLIDVVDIASSSARLVAESGGR